MRTPTLPVGGKYNKIHGDYARFVRAQIYLNPRGVKVSTHNDFIGKNLMLYLYIARELQIADCWPVQLTPK